MNKSFFGLPFVCFFVAAPMWANLLANIALTTELEPKSKVTLLARAYSSDPCNMRILQNLGDLSAANHFYGMAAWAYERATLCAPEQAVFHFTLGEAMIALNKNGIPEIDKSIELEPNNPIFKSERDRVTRLLSQLQSQSNH